VGAEKRFDKHREKNGNGNPKTIPNALEACIYAQRREKEISASAAFGISRFEEMIPCSTAFGFSF
jgi:hypothetical protein